MRMEEEKGVGIYLRVYKHAPQHESAISANKKKEEQTNDH